MCSYCNQKPVALSKKGKPKQYCSIKCQSAHTVEKRKITNLEKYGTENPMLLDSVKEKRKTTNIERYGTETPFIIDSVKNKYKQTCLERYGVEYASQSDEIKDRMKDSWKSYNNSHPFSDDVVRAKRESTLLEKYGVSHPILNEEIRKKIESTCIEIFGFPNAASSDAVKNRISDSITNGSGEFLRNPIWMKEQVSSVGVRGVSDILSVSNRVVRKYCDEHSIDFRSETGGSQFEHDIYLYIRQWYSGRIERNSKKYIQKELDIVLPDLNLAFECNGTYWHSDLNGRGRNYHLSKTTECSKIGIRLLHIWEHDWNLKKDVIQSRIKSLLTSSDVIPARKTKVKEISKTEADIFVDTNHKQGKCSAAINLGLFYNEKLVSVMTFSKSRFSKHEYEMIRFCSSLGLRVMGGASKLFKFFTSNFKPNSVISYSDKMYNTGEVYRNLGFVYSHVSPPAYYYTKDYITLESRIKFQKHKLSKLLENFDPDLSEWENMVLNGFDRVWDCGNDVWVWSCN